MDAPPPAIVVPAPAPRPPAGPWIAARRPFARAAWLAEHARFVDRAARGGIDVVFLGDSITAFFPTRGREVWERTIAPLGRVADFGISGDRTQWLLWRVENGELAHIEPRAVVLMIGTNNLATASAPAVARGVEAVVAAIRIRLPHARIVLNALLPRGEPGDPVRAKLAEVNRRLAPLADGGAIRWLDAGPGFVSADGTIPPALMPDGLHPAAAGYEVWGAALRPLLRELLST